MPLSAIVNRGAVVGRYAHYQLRFGGAFSVESAKGQRSPMSIRQYLQGHRFDDETVRRLGIAYEMTLVALRQRREDDPLRTAAAQKGAVAGVVGIESGVVSGVFNLESSGVRASDWRPRHDKR